MKLWMLAALLVKQGPNGGSIRNMMQGYRVRETEDEARGSFVAAVFEKNPDYAIDQMLVNEIPREHFPQEPEVQCCDT